MTNQDIFDLIYSEFRDKFDGNNVFFTQKYVPGKQQIRIHFLKEEANGNVIECLDFLNKLQEKFAYVSDWIPFYFDCFEAGNNIVFYQFLSENENEFRM